jgi:histidine phosphotransferase ChpT
LTIPVSGREGIAVADDTQDISALIGSRICHDLISPLGAIGNGVELLALSGHDQSPEITLIAESVESANARIRFFRVAFGAAAEEQTIGPQEIAAILDAFARAGRHSVDWGVSGGGQRLEVKLAFLVILCLESAMPWGGHIVVERSDDSWRLTGAAERIKLDLALWEGLGNPSVELRVSSAHVEFPLARLAAARIGRSLRIEAGQSGVTVTF